MEKIHEVLGVGTVQFELYKVVAYYVFGALIKVLFGVYTLIFVFLSIVRACDDANSASKKMYFRNLAAVGILALLIFFGWGYNPIIFLIIECVMLEYWSSESVAVWPILKAEWHEDWEPRLQYVLVFFRFLTRH